MTMKFKREFSFILTAAMILALLAGCGKTEAPASDPEPTQTQAAAYASGDVIYGRVTALSATGMTITKGEWNDETAELTTGNETVEITINDDTVFTRQFGGTPGGMETPQGQQFGGNNAQPQAPGGQGGEAPEMPGGQQGGDVPQAPGGQGGEAPEMPGGQQGGDVPQAPGGQGGEAPEMPGGQQGGDVPQAPGGQGGEAPEMPGGQGGGAFDMNMGAQEISLSDISLGANVRVTLGENNCAAEIAIMESGAMAMPGGMGGMGNMGGAPESYDAAKQYSSDTAVSGESFRSTGADENAVHVLGGAEVTLEAVTVERTSSNSTGGDNASFYGVGAAILVTDGTVTVSGSEIQTDSAGGAGVFAYGDGVAYVSDTVITTKQDTSGGIHVAGGGTLHASDLTVETSGESSAAIRSDRGSGVMTVDGGSYTSKGTGSPAVYSTADITVSNAALTAENSEAVCIEGLNSLRLYDCDLSGSMHDDARNDCTWNVILYQSMSGDSQVGNSTFEMRGGTLTAKNGGMFYTTNTESTFILSDVDISYAADSPFFLKCTGNANQRGWGSSGRNGADCTFIGINQLMQGSVIWDSISNLDLYLTSGSVLTGDIVNDESAAGAGGSGGCTVSIDSESRWVVTGDSTLTKLCCAGDIVDAGGNSVTIVGTDGTVYVQGSSAYKITVSEYSETVDLTAVSALAK